nr:hypothetical protein CFP56_28736 [Quercus suber]
MQQLCTTRPVARESGQSRSGSDIAEAQANADVQHAGSRKVEEVCDGRASDARDLHSPEKTAMVGLRRRPSCCIRPMEWSATSPVSTRAHPIGSRCQDTEPSRTLCFHTG